MEYREHDAHDHYLIKLSRGEPVMEKLTAFCEEQGIKNGVFHAIGAVQETRMGYYDLETREYVFHEYPETMEVVSMTGNVAQVDGRSFLHVHAVLSDTENRAHGGHIDETTVAVTLEVYLTAFGGSVERIYDDDVGLKLLNP